MFLQFPEPVLGRTRSTRKDSVRVTESFGIGIRRAILSSSCSLPYGTGRNSSDTCLPVELRRVGGGLLVTPQRQHAHPALNPGPGAFGHGLLGGSELLADSAAQFPALGALRTVDHHHVVKQHVARLRLDVDWPQALPSRGGPCVRRHRRPRHDFRESP